MAMVKCFYCGKYFDRNVNEYVEIPRQQGKRYAHKICADEQIATDDRKEQIALEQYIYNLFKLEYVPPRIKQQINDLRSKGLTYKDIRETLFYFYDVMKNPKSTMLANPNISIVEHIYPRAREYWKKLRLAQAINKDKKVEKSEVIKVYIQPQKREPMRKRQLFTFLDDEVNTSGE